MRSPLPPLTIGNRPSLRATVLMGAVLALVFPGLGILIIPSMFSDFQPGGLVWMAVWGSAVLPAWFFAVRHRIDGEDVATDARAGTSRRPIAEVVLVEPLPWQFPGARVTFADGTKLLAYGPHTRAFLRVLTDGAPHVENRLPAGNWLLPRRVLWFVVALIVGFSDA